ncbi:MAG: hypothetical protein KJ574_00835 [Nanoarchaeota archaeon]|nr:hypothetical protein [Nanoarchaeota archaeon]
MNNTKMTRLFVMIVLLMLCASDISLVSAAITCSNSLKHDGVVYCPLKNSEGTYTSNNQDVTVRAFYDPISREVIWASGANANGHQISGQTRQVISGDNLIAVQKMGTPVFANGLPAGTVTPVYGMFDNAVVTSSNGESIGVYQLLEQAQANLQQDVQAHTITSQGNPPAAVSGSSVVNEHQTVFDNSIIVGGQGGRAFLFCDEGRTSCIWTDAQGNPVPEGTIVGRPGSKYYVAGEGGSMPAGEDDVVHTGQTHVATYGEALSASIQAQGNPEATECASCELGTATTALSAEGTAPTGAEARQQLDTAIQTAQTQSTTMQGAIDHRKDAITTAQNVQQHLASTNWVDFKQTDVDNLVTMANDQSLSVEQRQAALAVLQNTATFDASTGKWTRNSERPTGDDYNNALTSFGTATEGTQNQQELDTASLEQLKFEMDAANKLKEKLAAGMTTEQIQQQAGWGQQVIVREQMAYNSLGTDLRAAGNDPEKVQQAWTDYYRSIYGYGDQSVQNFIDDRSEIEMRNIVLANDEQYDWTDKNGDGLVQQNEIKEGTFTGLQEQAMTHVSGALGQPLGYTQTQIQERAATVRSLKTIDFLKGACEGGTCVSWDDANGDGYLDQGELISIDEEGNPAGPLDADTAATLLLQYETQKSAVKQAGDEAQADAEAHNAEIIGEVPAQQTINTIADREAARHVLTTAGGQQFFILPEGQILPEGAQLPESYQVDAETNMIVAHFSDGPPRDTGIMCFRCDTAGEDGTGVMRGNGLKDGASMEFPDGTVYDYDETAAKEGKYPFKARKDYWVQGSLVDWVSGGPVTQFLKGLSSMVGTRCRACKGDWIYEAFGKVNLGQVWTEGICDSNTDGLGETFAISKKGGPSEAWVTAEVITVGDICGMLTGDAATTCAENMTPAPYMYKLQAIVNAQEVTMEFNICLTDAKGDCSEGAGKHVWNLLRLRDQAGYSIATDLILKPKQDETLYGPPVLDWHGPYTKVFPGFSQYQYVCIKFANGGTSGLDTDVAAFLTLENDYVCNKIADVNLISPYDPDRRQWEGVAGSEFAQPSAGAGYVPPGQLGGYVGTPGGASPQAGFDPGGAGAVP